MSAELSSRTECVKYLLKRFDFPNIQDYLANSSTQKVINIAKIVDWLSEYSVSTYFYSNEIVVNTSNNGLYLSITLTDRIYVDSIINDERVSLGKFDDAETALEFIEDHFEKLSKHADLFFIIQDLNNISSYIASTGIDLTDETLEELVNIAESIKDWVGAWDA